LQYVVSTGRFLCTLLCLATVFRSAHGNQPQVGHMEAGVVSAVGVSWRAVALNYVYSNPVVVCSVVFDNNSYSVLPRVRNAATDSFDLRLQNPRNRTSLQTETVYYLVVEEGVWQTPEGTSIEAARLECRSVNRASLWDHRWMTYHGYGLARTNPVVLGQVMSANDTDWSSFWASGETPADVPDMDFTFAGRHIGEDGDTSREQETLGIIVFEQGSGLVAGVSYEARVGSASVEGVANSPPFDYSHNLPSTPQVAILSSAAMTGADGAWPVLFGTTPLRSDRIRLAVLEDQIRDSERSHGGERVAWAAFTAPLSTELVAVPPAPPPAPQLPGPPPARRWPYRTGFELPIFPFASVPHNVDYWTVEEPCRVITNGSAGTGQSLGVPFPGAATRDMGGSAPTTVWVDLRTSLPTRTDVPMLPVPNHTLAAVCLHAEEGLLCLDGDGERGGIWRPAGIEVSPGSRISLRQDFAHLSWDIYIDGRLGLAGLGFACTNIDAFLSVTVAPAIDTLQIDDISIDSRAPSDLFRRMNGILVY